MALNAAGVMERQEVLDRLADEVAERIRDGEPFKVTIEVRPPEDVMNVVITEYT